MEIKSAKFVTSLPTYRDFQGRGLPQIAIAGKSNVGKSSLINTMCRVKNLAKTSSTPGKTRLINVFLLNQDTHLIDLPGYGYAKVSKTEKESWGSMMEGYFTGNQLLKFAVQLIDIRHEPGANDIHMVNFLRESGIPFIVAATKADKVSRPQRHNALMLIARTIAVQPWEIIAYSSQTGEGRDELLQRFDKMLEI